MFKLYNMTLNDNIPKTILIGIFFINYNNLNIVVKKKKLGIDCLSKYNDRIIFSYFII